MTAICVLGAGAFGTALAIALSSGGGAVRLWARDPEAVRLMDETRVNAARLAGVIFPQSLEVTADLGAALSSRTVLLAVPMQSLAGLLALPAFDAVRRAPATREGARDGEDERAGEGERAGEDEPRCFVACAKGVDLESGLGPTGVIAAACPGVVGAILTGPSFAADIARGLPTALTLACADPRAGAALQARLSTPQLRLYLSRDTVGAELGGALKNVVALAAGVAIGAGFGESARAAVITRGFAEIRRFAEAAGADPDTLNGLSGLGDLTLTATSESSRNYRAGLALGRGEGVPQGTTEGVATAAAVARLAAARGIAMPLTAMVAALTRGEVSAGEAAAALLARPLKAE
ncbi:NAD(P)H-dependent glycerol-3-phosphate dehydrogenase [Acuticoccus yangtzensis]|uniref:NAD(P)H-dependent glycerol-3-phosphate dehydrogenase n=1 Tax=Acuticoccus yangtzensis TaxID=1443441 RepID=UPI00094991B0|nr:NAD(P)H-dependent glycerol-3-phosphate dehydrogenase [Acuticoccus yangtzensis]